MKIGIGVRIGYGRAQSFDPASVSGLTVRLVASSSYSDAGTTKCVDGDGVYLLKDSTAAGNHVQQTTSSLRPLYKLDGGLPSVLADGVDDYLRSVSSFTTLTQPYSIYAVAKYVSFPNTGPTLCDGGAAGNQGRVFCVAGASPRTYEINAGATLVQSPTNQVVAGTYYTFRAVYNGASGSLSLNGGTATNGNTGSNSLSDVTLFASGGTPGSWGNVQLREYLLYAGALSAGDEAALLAYLRTTWGHY